MGFDAGSIVEPLNYNFDTLAKMKCYTNADGTSMFPELVGVMGTTKEPSDDAVQKMQRAFLDATKGLNPGEDVDPADQRAVAKALNELPREAFTKAEEDILNALAELCQGNPSRTELAALPYRQKREYIKWLQNELMNPES